MPAFCPQDPGGPVSQDEALRLLKTMRQHFSDVTYEHQIIRDDAPSDRLRTFDHASGATQAISWAIDLVKRLTIDPQRSRDALIKSAELLEQQAKDLRRRASFSP